MKKRQKRILCYSALSFALVLSIILPLAAMAAEASACYNIQDADARSYCIARARREPSQCYNVQRADMRAQCLAEVSR